MECYKRVEGHVIIAEISLWLNGRILSATPRRMADTNVPITVFRPQSDLPFMLPAFFCVLVGNVLVDVSQFFANAVSGSAIIPG